MATAHAHGHNWQCDKSLVECLNQLFTSGIACDVTFLVGEDRHRISAHKTILISRSPVFYTMLEGNLAEKGEIVVTDMEQEVFTMFLRYLYTDEIQLTVDIATSVLSAARKYMVDHLVTKCETFLKSSLTTENICLVLEHAHIYTVENLKQECLRVIAGSQEKVMEKVLKSTSFVDLCNVCVKSITESDDLKVEESVVYEAVMRWSEAECGRQGLEVTDNNRREVLGDILYTVRFPLIDARYLSNHVILRDVLTAEQLLSIQRFQKDNKAFPITEFNVNQRKVRKPVKGQFQCISRLGGTKNGAWNSKIRNDSDSISFVTTVVMFLHGLQLYGAFQKDRSILIGVYSGVGHTVYKEKHVLTHGELCTIEFPRIVNIRAGLTYTVVLHGGVHTKVYGKDGRTMVECRNGHITFLKSLSHLCKYTTTTQGQIPGLLVSF